MYISPASIFAFCPVKVDIGEFLLPDVVGVTKRRLGNRVALANNNPKSV